jgi:hypothetical protein
MAHVKWFCAYEVAGQPEGLANVLCEDFFSLLTLSSCFLLWACLLERSVLGPMALSALDRATSALRRDSELVMRAVLGFTLVSLWNQGGILLTPELRTELAWVPWMQLAMAACLMWRGSLPLVSLGIVVLFGMAAFRYGTFHLLDYPIFLGIAAYLAMQGTGFRPRVARPLDVVRWAAAVTLMWASVEKWAFPEWTYPLLDASPGALMGLDEAFYMRAAGMVEFALAFGLVWTPLVRRVSAIVLSVVFVGAVAGFGKIDAIGHAPIVAVLLAVAADDARGAAGIRRPVHAVPAFAGSLALFLAGYYVAHTILFGSGQA